MDWKERIVTDQAICGGRPRVKGTRLTVEFLLGLKAAGWREEDILQDYPHMKLEDLQAIYSYAQAIMQDESFLPPVMVA